MKTSPQGIDLIKNFESLKLDAYICPSGVLTIGYGHTKNVFKGQVTTENEAEFLLRSDLEETENQINELDLKLRQCQFDALVSFVFNLGFGNFIHSSLSERILANPDDLEIAGEFIKWTKSNGVKLRGLLKRRLAETLLYFSW